MATTFLDIGILKSVEILFPFILTWVVVFGLFQHTKFLGDRKGIHSIIAFVAAIFVILSPAAAALIKTVTPWFMVVLIFFLLCIVLFKVFGLPEEKLTDLITGAKGNEQLIWWIIVVTALIFLAGIGQVFFAAGLPNEPGTVIEGPDGTTITTEGSGEPGKDAFFNIIFHPKIIGMVFVMVIATFTIILLAGKPKNL